MTEETPAEAAPQTEEPMETAGDEDTKEAAETKEADDTKDAKDAPEDEAAEGDDKHKAEDAVKTDEGDGDGKKEDDDLEKTDGSKKDKKDRKEKDSKRDRKDRDKDRDRRDRDRGRRRGSRSRSRSRDRRDTRRRSRSRDRRSRDRRDRDRDYRRRSRSRSRDRHRDSKRGRDDYFSSRRRRRSNSRSDSEEIGGYVPRRRNHGDKPSTGPFSSSMTADTFDKAPSQIQGKTPAAIPAPPVVPVIDPAEALRQLQEQQLQARQMILQQQAASAAAAASKTQREVYVGNLAVGLVTDEILKTLFNNALVATFPQNALPGQEPVINVNMHSDGRYAFVELRSPEMATEALKIGGLQLLGQAISVGRPSGFVDPTLVQQQAQAAMLALQQFKAGGAALGTLPGVPGLPGVLPGAVAAPALNPLPIAPTTFAGMVPPGPPPMPGDGAPGATAGAAVAAAAAAPAAAGAAPAAAASGEEPTVFISVDKMFTAEVMASDEEYMDVMQDLQEECGKLGNVVDIKVPKPSDPSMVGQGNYGKAFVQFSTPQEAASVKQLLHGRSFDGQVLAVNYLQGMPN